MKITELKKLKVGDNINHTRYGLCEIRDILFSMGSFFGVVLRPKTDQGINQLQYDSGADIPDYMEDSLRSLVVL